MIAVSFVNIEVVSNNINKHKFFTEFVSINFKKYAKASVKNITSSVSFLAGIHTGHDINIG
jgi:hypothetical protein